NSGTGDPISTDEIPFDSMENPPYRTFVRINGLKSGGPIIQILPLLYGNFARNSSASFEDAK
ncbi:MAG TPA: hypothetical protein VII93_03740, partial [Anaerolineales bacterium]